MHTPLATPMLLANAVLCAVCFEKSTRRVRKYPLWKYPLTWLRLQVRLSDVDRKSPRSTYYVYAEAQQWL